MSACEKITVSNDVLLSLAQEFLDEGMKVLLPLKGESMLPFIRPGKDLALVEAKKDAAPGDVVLARTTAGNYVIHRVVRIEPDGNLILKGDGNLVGTETCTPEGVMGTVVQVQRPSGKIHFPRRVKSWQKLPLFLRRVVLALYKRTLGR